MLLKFCKFSRLIQDLAEVHPKKEEKIGARSPIVGLGLSCLVGVLREGGSGGEGLHEVLLL
jgi:hypothetical protein